MCHRWQIGPRFEDGVATHSMTTAHTSEQSWVQYGNDYQYYFVALQFPITIRVVVGRQDGWQVR